MLTKRLAQALFAGAAAATVNRPPRLTVWTGFRIDCVDVRVGGWQCPIKIGRQSSLKVVWKHGRVGFVSGQQHCKTDTTAREAPQHTPRMVSGSNQRQGGSIHEVMPGWSVCLAKP